MRDIYMTINYSNISISKELTNEIDKYLEKSSFQSRAEFIKFAVRKILMEEKNVKK